MTTSPTILSDTKSLNVNSPGAEVPSAKGIDGEFSQILAEHDGPIVETPVVEDEEYFLQSSFVFFQVENSLFRVPSYRFTRDSENFAEMFKLPQADRANVEGASRERPIILPDSISCVDFRNFLKALYPFPVAVTLSLSKAEWLSVLTLSSLWYFLSFRKVAIAELERTGALTPTEKVTWGRDVNISSWVVKGYQELVQRANIVNKNEALGVGYETAFSLFRLREQRIADGARCFDHAANAIDPVEEEFKDELQSIRAEEKKYAPKAVKGRVGGITIECTCADVRIDDGAKGTPIVAKGKKIHRR
ncbi:hypothetical protein NLJ89_g4609 [Agrocybe chaxingu]|uniref:BTB domain-containing protein n=1 Tax=Agrocybe chaxingu TaxID=84603 RepID=A0A9W8K2A8_9AGAR|nr:hypothetical protein NLJ89_g4609 [Agrocybe chaxingu]